MNQLEMLNALDIATDETEYKSLLFTVIHHQNIIGWWDLFMKGHGSKNWLAFLMP